MAKKKNQKRNEALKQKSATETLSFQTHWGLKNYYGEKGEKWASFAQAEVEQIAGLGLVQDILAIKKFVDDIKSVFHIEPCADLGDFCNSFVTLALGIGRHADIDTMGFPVTWNEQIEKKILKIFYPDEVRNTIFEWAKENGYKATTYLGKPIVKFTKLFILIDRTL